VPDEVVDNRTEQGGARLLVCVGDVLIAQRCHVGIVEVG
jgi:hypothetical protein